MLLFEICDFVSVGRPLSKPMLLMPINALKATVELSSVELS
jgi:hypothetical protein